MTIDVFDDDQIELFKWLEPDENNEKFHYKLKSDAPEKFKAVFEKVRDMFDRSKQEELHKMSKEQYKEITQ